MRRAVLAAFAICGSAAACTLQVDVFHHYQGERAAKAEPSGPQQVVAPTPARPAPQRYAELYLQSTPSLAQIRLIYDGISNVDQVIGTTPITIRLEPGKGAPFTRKSCGNEVRILLEKEGYNTEMATVILRCFSSAEEMEANPNEIRVSLKPI
jgi:hypothetical protein